MTAKQITERLDRIEGLIGDLSKTTAKPYDLAAGAEYLHLSRSHLYQLTSKGLIGHFKPAGKKIYFDKNDLDEYLRRHRVKPQWEIDQNAANHEAN